MTFPLRLIDISLYRSTLARLEKIAEGDRGALAELIDDVLRRAADSDFRLWNSPSDSYPQFRRSRVRQQTRATAETARAIAMDAIGVLAMPEHQPPGALYDRPSPSCVPLGGDDGGLLRHLAAADADVVSMLYEALASRCEPYCDEWRIAILRSDELAVLERAVVDVLAHKAHGSARLSFTHLKDHGERLLALIARARASAGRLGIALAVISDE